MKPLYCLLLLLLFSACRTIKYVPVETVRTDTTYIYRASVDTVLKWDSIYIVDRGDTVREYRYKYIYKYRTAVDTFYLSRADTISVPYPVEKELSTWQRMKVDYGGWAMLTIVITILIVVGRMVYKLKK